MKLKNSENAEAQGANLEGISFDSILNELSSTTKRNVLGNMEFKEITMKQQRKIMNGGYDNIEISAKFADVYNEFIAENVVVTNDIVPSTKVVTLETKPYVLNVLRTLTLGNTYYDDETDKVYVLNEVTEDDLIPKIEDESIEFGNVKIVLSVPDLERDTKYNKLLCIALNPYKKKNLKDSDTFPVMDLYQTYEIFKYIKTISFKGVDYDFDQVSMNDKNKLLNSLHASIVNQITDYIKRVEDVKEVALKATDSESGETISPSVYTLFFAKTAKK